MTIEYKNGDMFSEPVEAIVNTVNCVGVMGKGVALEFKHRWPDNFKAYKRLCDDKKLSTGQMFVFDNNDFLDGGKHRYLINFPTKQHWRSRSKIEYVQDGLIDFVHQIRELGIKSVALPPLGCGNGGLDWAEVRPLIETALDALRDVHFVIFVPAAEQSAQTEQSHVPNDLTTARASMMVAFAELEKFFGGHLTRLTAQKITYFLQVLGVDFGLKFAKHRYGPYSETLHDAFKAMEAKNYIYGYTSEERRVVVTPGTYAAADAFLGERRTDLSAVIEKLSLLVEGYESPYAMELLASVHFLSVAEGTTTQPEMSWALEAWNDHKRASFPEPAVSAALERLKEDGLIR